MTRKEAKIYIKRKMCKDCLIYLGGGSCSDDCHVIAAIKALEQQPYEKFESTKDHIYKLAGDYKCWDNRLTQDEALELCHILEQQSEDAISRSETVQFLINHSNDFEDAKIRMAFQAASSLVNNPHNLPSVYPKPKTGHWIKTTKAIMGEGYLWYCNKCRHEVYQDSSKPYPSEKYCSNCGAIMIDPQENEDKE